MKNYYLAFMVALLAYNIGHELGLKSGEKIGRKNVTIVMNSEMGKMRLLIKNSCEKHDYRFLCEINKRELGEP